MNGWMLVSMLALLVIGGAVLGVVAFALTLAARTRIARVEHELLKLRLALEAALRASQAPTAPSADATSQGEPHRDELSRDGATRDSSVEAIAAERRSAETRADVHAGAAAAMGPAPAALSGRAAVPPVVGSALPDVALQGGWWSALTALLRRRWVESLAGLSLALAALWFARLVIEQGWIGPLAQIGLGLVIGVVAQVGALQGLKRVPSAAVAWATLAGAASTLLYALGLVALHLHVLIPPGVALLWLGGVAVFTMLLAGRQAAGTRAGLVAFGLVGGHAAPLWLGGEAGSPLILLYALMLTVTGLLALRARFVAWLWALVLVLAAFWGAVALSGGVSPAAVAFYAAAFGVAMLGIPGGFAWTAQALRPDGAGLYPFWRMRALGSATAAAPMGDGTAPDGAPSAADDPSPNTPPDVQMGTQPGTSMGAWRALSLAVWRDRYAWLAVLLCAFVAWMAVRTWLAGSAAGVAGGAAGGAAGDGAAMLLPGFVIALLPLGVALWWALGEARANAPDDETVGSLRFAPWLVFSGLLATLWSVASGRFAMHGDVALLGGVEAVPASAWAEAYPVLAAWAVAMIVAGASQGLRGQRAVSAASIHLAPLVAVALAWSITPEGAWPWWASAALLAWAMTLGGIAWARLRAAAPGPSPILMLVAAHLAYALAALGALEGGSLTVALAVIVASAVVFWRRFALAPLDPLIRVVAWAVVVRLALTPFLPGAALPGTVWALWPYVLTAGVLLAAAWWARRGVSLQTGLDAGLARQIEGAGLVATVWCGHLAVPLMFAESMRGGWWPHQPLAALWLAALWSALALAYVWTLPRPAEGVTERWASAGFQGVDWRSWWVLILLAGAVLWVVLAVLAMNPLWDGASAWRLAEAFAGRPLALMLAWSLPAVLAAAVLAALPALLRRRRSAAFDAEAASQPGSGFGALPLHWRLRALQVAALALVISAAVIVVRLGWRWLAAPELVTVAPVVGPQTVEMLHLSAGWIAGEVWTYTALGVVVALVAARMRRVSIAAAVLALVAAKVFVFDLWWLSGLWQVAAAVTLGAGLLAYAVLRARQRSSGQPAGA